MISCNIGNGNIGSAGKDVSVITLYLQPYNGFPQGQLQKLQSDVQHCLDTLIPELKFDVKLRNGIDLPASCYYKPRNRYRADSIIRYQRTLDNSNYIMGVMSQDISTTVHDVKDWGVLGLSFRPGKSAVVSNYRVKNKSLFYKVLVHEFLHNLGLPHCSLGDRSCYICDANKHPQLEKQTQLCPVCKAKLLRLRK
jgi:archaemetzincin